MATSKNNIFIFDFSRDRVNEFVFSRLPTSMKKKTKQEVLFVFHSDACNCLSICWVYDPSYLLPLIEFVSCSTCFMVVNKQNSALYSFALSRVIFRESFCTVP